MNGLGKLPLVQLELFSLLVYYELKDAYLVDCCFLDEELARRFLSHLQTKYELKSGVLLTIVLEGDVLFANRRTLCRKLNDLEHKKDSPVVINMSGGLTVMEDSGAPLQFVHGTFCSLQSLELTTAEFIIRATEELRVLVGLPFLAGWLLGYPCLYRAVDNGLSTDLAEDLAEDSSMINLLKMSVTATVSIRYASAGVKCTKKQKGKVGTAAAVLIPAPITQTVEVLGFSIPECLWESDPSVRVKLQALFDATVASIRRQAEQVNGSPANMIVSAVKAEQKVYTVPKIAL